MQFNTPQISCAKLSSILLKAILPTRSAVATLLRSIFPTSSLIDLQIILSRVCTSTLWKSSWETRDGDTSSLSPSPDWYALGYTDKTDGLEANGQFVGGKKRVQSKYMWRQLILELFFLPTHWNTYLTTRSYLASQSHTAITFFFFFYPQYLNANVRKHRIPEKRLSGPLGFLGNILICHFSLERIVVRKFPKIQFQPNCF